MPNFPKLTPSSRRPRTSSRSPLGRRPGGRSGRRFKFPLSDSPVLLASLVLNSLFVGTWGFGVLRDRIANVRPTPKSVAEYARNVDEQLAIDSRAMAIARGASPSKESFTYQDWIDILQREASEIAQAGTDRLYVLAGDSISQWFPESLLPPDADWLNQSISGEGAEGLYDRLTLLDETDPTKIFVMIGINDLLRGMDDKTLLEHQRRIIKDILWIHPNVEVIVQSILPHGGDKSTWEGKAKLERIPNERIRSLNKRLAAIADYEGATFLDLYDLFGTEEGTIRPELSTDGLHLNAQGYLVWRTALMVFINDRTQESTVEALTPSPDRIARYFRLSPDLL